MLFLLSVEASDLVLLHIESLLRVLRLLLNESNHGFITLRVEFIVVGVSETLESTSTLSLWISRDLRLYGVLPVGNEPLTVI